MATEEQLQNLYSWIDTIPLTRPKKNISRDFSDAVPAAEVVRAYIPKLVDIHNYPPANSVSQKLYNWNTLNQKVLRKLGMNLSDEAIQYLAYSKPGQVELFLLDLQQRLELYRQQKLAYRQATAIQSLKSMVSQPLPLLSPSQSHVSLHHHQQQQNYPAGPSQVPPYTMDNNQLNFYPPQPGQAWTHSPPSGSLYNSSNSNAGFAYQQQPQQPQASFARTPALPPIPSMHQPSRPQSTAVQQQQQQQQQSLQASPARARPYTQQPQSTREQSYQQQQQQQQEEQQQNWSQNEGLAVRKSGILRKTNSNRRVSSESQLQQQQQQQQQQQVEQQPSHEVLRKSNTTIQNNHAASKDTSEKRILELKLKEKDVLITDLQETVGILQLKIQKLEQLLDLKDKRIQELAEHAGSAS